MLGLIYTFFCFYISMGMVLSAVAMPHDLEPHAMSNYIWRGTFTWPWRLRAVQFRDE